MTLADWRDVAVIALAFFFTVQVFVVIVLIAILIKVAMEIRERVDKLLVSTHATLQNINGTASFVGDKVASPIIRGISFASGVKRVVGALAASKRNGR